MAFADLNNGTAPNDNTGTKIRDAFLALEANFAKPALLPFGDPVTAPAANQFPYYGSSTTLAYASVTTFARTILDDADANAVRNTIDAPVRNGPAKGVADMNAAMLGQWESYTGTHDQGAANNWPNIGAGGGAVWWNVFSIGTSTRTTQFAVHGFGGASRFFVRQKHDATWYPWREVMTSHQLTLGTGVGAFEVAREWKPGGGNYGSGIYAYNTGGSPAGAPSGFGYGSVLTWSGSVAGAGAAQLAIGWAGGQDILAFRSLRDTTENWYAWKKVYHETNKPTKADVGLDLVDNTSDANKPVSTATTAALNLKANLASPTFTGSPAAPTAAVATNTTQVATTAFVQAAVPAYATSRIERIAAADHNAGSNPNGVVIPFPNAGDYASGLTWDGTNHRCAPAVAGLYLVTATVLVAAATGGDMSVSIAKNGAERGRWYRSGSAGGVFHGETISAAVYCNGTSDSIDCRVIAVNGGATTLWAGRRLSIVRLSA